MSKEGSWPDRLARGFALLRGVMLVGFSIFLLAAPEQAMPGSSTDPARSLALVFASRTILLGLALALLAVLGARRGLGWLLLADAALQVFDVGLAIATGQGAVAALPAALGLLDVWAGLTLLGVARRAREGAAGA